MCDMTNSCGSYCYPHTRFHSYVWHDSFEWMSRMNESCHTYERIIRHVRTRTRFVTHSYVWHDSFIYETWLIHIWHMTRSYVWHDSFIYETWPIHMWDMTHSYMRHVSFIRETQLIFYTSPWLFHRWDTLSHLYVRHDSSIHETWLIHTWDMTHSYMRHDSFIYETLLNSKYVSFIRETQLIFYTSPWLFHRWDTLSHSYMRHDSFTCETWRIHIWDMTHSYMRHDAFLYETWPIHTRDMTHSYVRHDSFIHETRLIHMRDVSRRAHLLQFFLYCNAVFVAVCCSELQQTHTRILWSPHRWGFYFLNLYKTILVGKSFHRLFRVSYMNESCLTYEWDMSHIWMSRVSRTNESCLT